ncbi:MAG: LysR substrate-binding domain-containing protein [Janthinobacterium lividum]
MLGCDAGNWCRRGRAVEHPAATFSLNDGDAVVHACCRGWDLCQIPAFMLQPYLDAGTLVEVLSDFVASPADIHALWFKSRQTPPKIRRVVDALIANDKTAS